VIGSGFIGFMWLVILLPQPFGQVLFWATISACLWLLIYR
jgi:hypothetical protein